MQHIRSLIVLQVLKEASRLYAASWVRDIGPELRPNDYKKHEETEDEAGGARGTAKEKEPSTLEHLGKKCLPCSFWFDATKICLKIQSKSCRRSLSSL